MERMYHIIGHLQALAGFMEDSTICNTMSDDKIGVVIEFSKILLDELMNQMGEHEEYLMTK